MKVKRSKLNFRRVIESVLGKGDIKFKRPNCRRSDELVDESSNGSTNSIILIEPTTEIFAITAWTEPSTYMSKGQATQCIQVEAINCQHIYSFDVNDEGWKAGRTCDINSSWLHASHLLRWLFAVDLTQEGCGRTYLAYQGGSEPHLFTLPKGLEGESHDA